MNADKQDYQITQHRTILCVDDEPGILRALIRLLKCANYHCIAVSSGDEGLQALKDHDIQVVLSDQRMPDMVGTQFLKQVTLLYPKTIRVLLSGYAQAEAVMNALNKGDIHYYFTKPWDDHELLENIEKCFQAYETSHL